MSHISQIRKDHASSTPSERLRSLGEEESRFALQHAHFAGASQCMAVLVLSYPVVAERLTMSLGRLLDRYQILRCAIQDNTEGPHFIESPLEPGAYLRITSVPSKDDAWRKIEQALNTPLESRRMLWRVEVLATGASTFLCLTFHHAAIDGSGLVRVAKDLLAALIDGSAAAGEVEPLPVCMDSLLRIRKPSGLPETNRYRLPYETDAPGTERRTTFTRLKLSRTESDLIREEAARADLHVHSLWMGVLLSARASETPTDAPLAITTGISLREMLAGSGYRPGLGCCTTEITTQLQQRSCDIFAHARDYQKSMVRALMRATSREEWSWPRLRDQMFADFAAGGFSTGVRAINLGIVDSDLPAAAEIDEFWVLRNCNDGRHAFTISLCELQQCYNLCVAQPQPLVSCSRAQAFASGLERSLAQLLPAVEMRVRI